MRIDRRLIESDAASSSLALAKPSQYTLSRWLALSDSTLLPTRLCWSKTVLRIIPYTDSSIQHNHDCLVTMRSFAALPAFSAYRKCTSSSFECSIVVLVVLGLISVACAAPIPINSLASSQPSTPASLTSRSTPQSSEISASSIFPSLIATKSSVVSSTVLVRRKNDDDDAEKEFKDETEQDEKNDKEQEKTDKDQQQKDKKEEKNDKKDKENDEKQEQKDEKQEKNDEEKLAKDKQNANSKVAADQQEVNDDKKKDTADKNKETADGEKLSHATNNVTADTTKVDADKKKVDADKEDAKHPTLRPSLAVRYTGPNHDYNNGFADQPVRNLIELAKFNIAGNIEGKPHEERHVENGQVQYRYGFALFKPGDTTKPILEGKIWDSANKISPVTGRGSAYAYDPSHLCGEMTLPGGGKVVLEVKNNEVTTKVDADLPKAR
ncbi:hypothetical protein J3R30DRAFT_3400055 [Lentinula aciculospora]|uniref:Uncharacterized protein n=1 Tax=Lentinula aciculospora TaxID=153920 RepID=A0A9W9DXJ7_9AGAR|nr:hypothetical protein J3R30DRAFT_3400055 [Lentinula aciculospora]